MIKQVAIKVITIFAAFFVAQWFIPYYVLVVGALFAGFFSRRMSEDASWSYALIIGGVLFGIFAYVSANFLQKGVL